MCGYKFLLFKIEKQTREVIKIVCSNSISGEICELYQDMTSIL